MLNNTACCTPPFSFAPLNSSPNIFCSPKQQPEKKAAVGEEGVRHGDGRWGEGAFCRQLSRENKSVEVVYYIILVLLPHRNTNRGKVVSSPKAQANLKHISALVV